MGWDSNWETSGGKGKLTRRAFNQLREACQERSTGAGRTMPALIASNIEKYRRVKKAHKVALHNEITALINSYVNHTDHSGSWAGQTSIPNWTEATILAAIGGSSRIAVSNDHVKTAGWNNQTRKILNKLKWYAPSNSLVNKYYREGTEWTWAGAVAEFNANSWKEGGIYEHYIGHWSYRNPDGSHVIYRVKADASISNPFLDAISFDIYINTIPVYWSYGSSRVYENNDYPNASGTYLLADSNSVPGLSTVTKAIGNISNVTASEPATAAQTTGWDGTQGKTIIKYDNAFKYKDW